VLYQRQRQRHIQKRERERERERRKFQSNSPLLTAHDASWKF
jgi:hypothetical protein